MANYYSSQSTVEARASAYRLILWADTDGDDTPDAQKLEQGFAAARAEIDAYIYERYGSQVSAWTISTAPQLIRYISDNLCMGYFTSGNIAQAELIDGIVDDSRAMLERIRDYEMMLPGVDDYDDEIYTDTMDSEYDDDYLATLDSEDSSCG